MNKKMLLQCLKINKIYQEGNTLIKVLNNINFNIFLGDMIVIIGKSGSGKSTFLHIAGGLDQPNSGKVIFEGKQFNHLSSTEMASIHNQRIGFIYQFHYLLPDFSSLENVAMPMLIGKHSPSKSTEKAKKFLEMVGMKKRIYHYPSKLSGGERQRVAIARALINNPILVLADEPTGNLDQENTDNILQLLKEFNSIYNTTFLVVTHDLQLAQQFPKKFWMKKGKLNNNYD